MNFPCDIMKNDVSYVDKLLKWIFLDFQKNWMPDPENPKPGSFFCDYILSR